MHDDGREQLGASAANEEVERLRGSTVVGAEQPPAAPDQPTQSAHAPVRKPDFLVAGDGSYAVVEYDDGGAQVILGRILPLGGLYRAYRYDNKGHESVLATFESLKEALAAFPQLSGQGFQPGAGVGEISRKWSVGCVIAALIPIILFGLWLYFVGSGFGCIGIC